MGDIFFEVPVSNLVGFGVYGWDARFGLWGDCGLLVSILAVAELEDFAHKNTLGVSRVRT